MCCLWRPGLQTRANNQAVTLTVFSGACYKPHMWNRLNYVAGVALLAMVAVYFFGPDDRTAESPAARRRTDTSGTSADRRNAVVDVQRRR